MYADFFGLRELPFNNTPDPRFFYSTPDHEEALASLIYAVQQRKGFVLLTGEVGAGKTLVSRMMLRHFSGTVEFATINHAIETAADLMEAVCTELELPIGSDMSNTQLVRVLHDFLLAKFAQNVPVVLVLDEAQNLPLAAFEQLRMIGNLESDDAKLLQICIVGQPELQAIVNSPQVRQLKQRIFRAFHLPALDRAATEAYIRHRLKVAGAPADVQLFGTMSMDRVYDYSRGLPRLINAVCDNAMLSAYSAGKSNVDDSTIEGVIHQMMLADGGSSQEHEHHDRPAYHRRPDACRENGPAPSHLPARAPGGPSHDPGWGSHALLEIGTRLRTMELELGRLAQAPDRTDGRPQGRPELPQAEAILQRVQAESADLQVKEQKLRQLSLAVKATAVELSRLLDRLQKSAEQSRESAAQAKSIWAKMEPELARADAVLHSLAAVNRNWGKRIGKAASIPAAAVERASGPVDRMLEGTRSTINDLRDLGRDRGGKATNAGTRLVAQAENLLSILEPARES